MLSRRSLLAGLSVLGGVLGLARRRAQESGAEGVCGAPTFKGVPVGFAEDLDQAEIFKDGFRIGGYVQPEHQPEQEVASRGQEG